MATRRVNLNSVNNENDTQKLIFSEWDPIFLFDAPWIKKQGIQGLQKYYQVYLSAANPSNFFSGSLSTINLSSVNYFSAVSAPSWMVAAYPAFSGFNLKDAGCNILINRENQTIKVDMTPLSARAIGHFILVITAPGGYLKYPGSGAPGDPLTAAPFYIQSKDVQVTPTPTRS